MSKSVLPILSEFGPLNIMDYESFLIQSKIAFHKLYGNKITDKCKLENYEIIQTIGVGGFGKVFLISHQGQSIEYYAMKVMEKRKILKFKELEHTLNEKNILHAINFPFGVHMLYYNIDNTYLYFVLPFIVGGELYKYLKKSVKFDEVLIRFYAAQIILAFEYLHHLQLVYRDLKPENVLIDHFGYIKLTDFGFCKLVKSRTWTMCGTTEYLAPEMIKNQGYGQSVDWWMLGILTYEMATGHTPFHSKIQSKVIDKISNSKYLIPSTFSIELQTLIKGLIEPDVSKRIGNLKDGVNEIKSHIFFRSIEWLPLFNRKVTPPFVPKSKGLGDPSNYFKFEDEILVVSSEDKFVKEFEGF